MMLCYSCRILTHFYPLNSHNNMWLEVGIALLPEPHVEITLVNRLIEQIPLTEEAFEKMRSERGCVLRYLIDNNPVYKSEVLNFNDVALRYGTVDERSTVCLSVHDIDVLIMKDTWQTVTRLHDSIKGKIVELKNKLPAVTGQLAAFVHIIKGINDDSKAYEAIISSPKYRRGEQLDNEMLVICFADIKRAAKLGLVPHDV